VKKKNSTYGPRAYVVWRGVNPPELS